MKTKVLQYLARLWTFWGPRLTDRVFLAAIGLNLVAAGVISASEAQVNAWVFFLWAFANMIAPTWDAFPDGETLSGKRAQG